MSSVSVSAVITTFHRDACVIRNAIDSILNQTYPVMEILVVDDNENCSEYSESVFSMLSRFYSGGGY